MEELETRNVIMNQVKLIVAVGNYISQCGFPIGQNGTIPWHNSNDMKWFKEMTIGHPVIMGRKTYESLNKPLKDRINIVVTKQTAPITSNVGGVEVHIQNSLEDAIKCARQLSDEDIFIIGGASVYKEALDKDLVDVCYIDFLDENVHNADTFFNLPKIGWLMSANTVIEEDKAKAVEYIRLRGLENNHVDDQYISLVNEIIEKGEIKDTRAGKTRSLFSRQLRFNLKDGLPMLTTKKMFSKGVIHELLWFLKGDTNIKYLVDNNVHIWDDDAYRYYLNLCKEDAVTSPLIHTSAPISKEEFLEKVKSGDIRYFNNIGGKLYVYGDLNNVYGYQWTKWGGHNQIQEVIDKLKTNPDDRRMIVSAWNIEDIPAMALPPCHFCCQFYTKKMSLEERRKWIKEKRGEDVGENIELLDECNVPIRKLSCVWHQRSVDAILGLPFNIMSYAILTYMIAQCVNMDVDELIFDGGDCHVYNNQIEIYKKEQKNRNPYMYALPTLRLKSDIKNIFDFKYDDITIEGYNSYPIIKYPLSVGL